MACPGWIGADCPVPLWLYGLYEQRFGSQPSEAGVIYIMTHDSIALGEDGYPPAG